MQTASSACLCNLKFAQSYIAYHVTISCCNKIRVCVSCCGGCGACGGLSLELGNASLGNLCGRDVTEICVPYGVTKMKVFIIPEKSCRAYAEYFHKR